MKDSLIDIRTLSVRLCIPIGSIRNALWRQQEGQIIPAPIRLGRRLRWSETAVDEFLACRAVIKAAPDPTTPSYRLSARGRPTKRSQLMRVNSACATGLAAGSAPSLARDVIPKPSSPTTSREEPL